MPISSKFVHRTPLLIAFLDLMLVVSLFLAPLSVPEGSVTDLDANANWIDHSDRWADMKPFPRVVYTFGDLNCHQMMDRTIIINGNQMPMCSRDISIFIGLMLGALLLTRAVAHDHPSLIFTSILPKRIKSGFISRYPAFLFMMVIGLLLVPTAVDGGVQALSTMSLLPGGLEYESTNPTRVITGFPMGLGVGMLITSLLMALLSRRDDDTDNLIMFLIKK